MSTYQAINEPVSVLANFPVSDKMSERCSIISMKFQNKQINFRQTFYLKRVVQEGKVTHWMDAIDDYMFYHFKYEIFRTGEHRWTLLTTYF